jgi:hypothetical protein
MLSMQVLEMRGGYLYQHRPDVMPHGYLTDEEVSLWAAYWERRGNEQRASRR